MRTTTSLWLDGVSLPEFQPIDGEITADVAVAGGGLAGLLCAYFLQEKGLSVAVLEAGRIGHGTSGHTTAKVTSQHGLMYSTLIRNYGVKKAKSFADALQQAIDKMEALALSLSPDCDFRRLPSYVFTHSEHFSSRLKNEATAAAALGIPCSLQRDIDLPFDVLSALRFDRQAQFHPVKFIKGLVDALKEGGCRIFEKSVVTEVSDGSPCVLHSGSSGRVRAKYAVLATHYPCFDGGRMFFARLRPERSYLVAGRTEGPLPEGIYYRAERPGRSLRTAKHGDETLLIVGGEGHKTGHGDRLRLHFKHLVEYGERQFKSYEPLFMWSAQDYITTDSLPYAGFLGEDSKLLALTGFNKWGMTNSLVCAELVRDLICLEKSPLERLLSPNRIKAGAIPKLAAENADVAYQLVTGKLRQPVDPDTIRKGEAGIVNLDGQKYGAFRGEDGELLYVDCTCTHMGCELHFNDAEQTWDCPCHGSRFTTDGTVVEGPALHPLKRPPEKNRIDPKIYNPS